MEKKLIQYHIKKFLFTKPKWANSLFGELGVIMSPPVRGGSINIPRRYEPGRSHYRFGENGEIFRDNWLGEGRRSTVLTSVRPQSGSPLIMGTGGGIESVGEEFYSRRDMVVDSRTGEIFTNDWGTNPCCEMQTDYICYD